MGNRLSHFLGAAILCVWGAVMVYFYASGRSDDYLAREFQVYSLIAGLGLCVLGLFNLLTAKAETECGHEHHGHDGEHDHEHDHGRVTFFSLLILLVPMLGALKLSPDEFSATAVMNKGLYSANYENTVISDRSAMLDDVVTGERASPDVKAGEAAPGDEPAAEEEESWGEYTLADLEAQVDKTEEGNYLLTVPQLFYTAGDEELQRVLAGLPVETVAQVMPEKVNNPNGTRLRIFRLFIECCAADARPLSIPIEFGKTPPEYREMGWMKIIGKMTYKVEDGITIPILQVTLIEETEAPEEAMMF